MSTLERIETHVNVEAAVRDADIVIEVVPERMNLKKELCQKLDFHAPDDIVFATNTPTLVIIIGVTAAKLTLWKNRRRRTL